MPPDIEMSHGKPRMTGDRITDLGEMPDDDGTAAQRRANHDRLGRAAPRNKLSKDRGVKRAIKRLAGKTELTDPVAEQLSRDALRLIGAYMRELPSNAHQVRSRVASQARHEVLAAYFHERALEVGLSTEEGMVFDERASKHDHEALRHQTSALHAAKALAGKRGDINPIDAANARIDADVAALLAATTKEEP